MAAVIPTQRWPGANEEWQPPYDVVFGISEASCGATKVIMARVAIPPGGGNECHVHRNTEALGFVVRGRFRNGLGYGDRVEDLGAGDFWHFARGEPHWSRNLSAHEPCVMVSAYTGVGRLEDTQTTYYDPVEAATLPAAPVDLPETGQYGRAVRSTILRGEVVRVDVNEANGIETRWGVSGANSNVERGISFVQTFRPGGFSGRQRIRNAELGMFVLRGELAVEADSLESERTLATEGSFVYIPRDEEYRVWNEATQEAAVYGVFGGVAQREKIGLAEGIDVESTSVGRHPSES